MRNGMMMMRGMGHLEAKGIPISQFVDMMSRQGIRFAPASSGNESYYTALHRAIVTYYAGLGKLTR